MNEQSLRDALAAPALTLDEDFADALDRRLRAAAAAAPVAELQTARARRGVPPMILIIGIAAAVIGALAIALVLRPDGATKPTGLASKVLAYQFSTNVVVTYTPQRSTPDGAMISGVVNVADYHARMIIEDASHRHPAQHYLQTATEQYTPVADWRLENLPTNAIQERILAGKHWVGDRRTEGSPRFTVDGLFVYPSLVAQYDVLADLRAAGAHPVLVGTERIRGIETRHYRARSDKSVTYNTGTRVTRRTIDVWIDAHGRIVRLHAVADYPETDDSSPETIDATTDYLFFAHTVTIAVPAPNDVADGKLLIDTHWCGVYPLSPPADVCNNAGR